MKILRSIHTVNPALGGPIESVKQSSSTLMRRGHDVEIISLDAPDDPWVRDCPVKVHALGPGRSSYGYAPGFVSWIKERHATYDAVIVQGIWQYSSFGVWRAVAGTSTPYFVFPHGMLDPWFKRTYPLKHVKKLLYWPWAEYRVLRDAAAVFFTSEEERRLARESFSFYRCNEVVVNYGTAAPEVDLARAREDFFQRFPQLRGKRLLLFLGRLHEKKGCDLAIAAFANVLHSAAADPSLHLVIAGPCAGEKYLAQLKLLAAAVSCRDSRNSPVTFTGMLAGNQKWGALSAADAFILPSHQENFGIAVVEALACGTPVLISKEVNIWREIDADQAGYAEKDDLAGTVRLIERWFGTAEDDRAGMRENARKCFADHFEINRATDSLLQALGQRPAARTKIASPNP
jgi:glycosyltransferase involved in cell wall biosynthesis